MTSGATHLGAPSPPEPEQFVPHPISQQALKFQPGESPRVCTGHLQ